MIISCSLLAFAIVYVHHFIDWFKNFKIVNLWRTRYPLGLTVIHHTVHHENTMTFLSCKYFSHGLPDCQTDRNFLSLESSYFHFRARVSSSVLFLFKGFPGMAPMLYFNCSAILDNYEIENPREIQKITSEWLLITGSLTILCVTPTGKILHTTQFSDLHNSCSGI